MYSWSRTIILLILISLISCKKDSACFHSYGSEIETPIIYELEDFNSLVLDANVFVNLVNDSSNYMEIIGGENAVKFVNYSIENGELKILNDGKCNWLRDYQKRIQVNLHFKDLNIIQNISDGKIENENELNLDTIRINQNGTGGIHLNLNAERIWVNCYVIGDVELQGECASMIAVVGSYGNLKASEMESGWINVTTIHEGDAHVFPVKAMKATCEQLGDIYYYNDIENLDIMESVEGKVEFVQE